MEMNNSNISVSHEKICRPLFELGEVSAVQGTMSVLVALLMSGNLVMITASSRAQYTPNRVYVAVLSAIDFYICINYLLLSASSLALSGRYPESSHPVQIIVSFSLEASTITSLVFLTLIAVDRYLVVCHPTKPMLTKRQVKSLVLVIGVLAFAGTAMCKVLLEDMLLSVFCFSWNVTSAVMLFCYSRLSWTLYRRAQVRKRLVVGVQHADPLSGTTQSATTDTNDLGSNMGITACGRPHITRTSPERHQNVTRKTCRLGSHLNSVAATGLSPSDNDKNRNLGKEESSACWQNETRRKTASRQGKKPSKTANLIRTSVMLLTVTLLFFVSWTPFLLAVHGIHPACNWRHTFVLNSVVNPFVFILMSRHFREDVKKSLPWKKK